MIQIREELISLGWEFLTYAGYVGGSSFATFQRGEVFMCLTQEDDGELKAAITLTEKVKTVEDIDKFIKQLLWEK